MKIHKGQIIPVKHVETSEDTAKAWDTMGETPGKKHTQTLYLKPEDTSTGGPKPRQTTGGPDPACNSDRFEL